jgi:hypothetical protein
MLTQYKNWNPATAEKNRSAFAKDLEAYQKR